MDNRERIREYIIANFLFGDSEPLTGDDLSLMESGIVDSVGVLEIIAFLEQEFSMEISDEDLTPDNFNSVNRLTAFVASKVETAICEDPAAQEEAEEATG